MAGKPFQGHLWPFSVLHEAVTSSLFSTFYPELNKKYVQQDLKIRSKYAHSRSYDYFYVLMILDVDEYRVVPARQIQRESTGISEPGTMHSLSNMCWHCQGTKVSVNSV